MVALTSTIKTLIPFLLLAAYSPRTHADSPKHEHAGGPVSLVRQAPSGTLADRLEDIHGNPLFTPVQYSKFIEAGGTLEYAKRLAHFVDPSSGAPVFSGFHIYRSQQLGLDLNDILRFNDTPKPNAVIVYPTTHYNVAFENKGSLSFFQRVRQHYDVWVSFASRERDVYGALLKIPRIELLVLSGHGTKTSLSLGDYDPGEIRAIDETYKIDMTDVEIEMYLNLLDPNAVIFLLSCSNGEGADDEENLANFIIERANNRQVFAAIEDFQSRQIAVVSDHPFSVQLTYDPRYDYPFIHHRGRSIVPPKMRRWRDITYTNRQKD